MFGYRVPDPDEAMLISGRKSRGDNTPFRVVTGHGTFVMPVFRRARFLTLSMCEAEVSEVCVTKQGISRTPNFYAVPGPNSRWYVDNMEIAAVQDFCRRPGS